MSERRRYSSEKTKEALRHLVEGVPDAFFVLTGNMRWNEAKGKYVTSSFGVGDENSARVLGTALPAGGRDRVLATVEMNGAYPEAYLVAMSKSRDENKPTYASLIKDELMGKGVNEKQILLEEVSVDTITEYKEAARFWKERSWHNLVFVLAEWHVPRAMALFNHIEDFADSDEERELLSEFVRAIKSNALTVQFLDTTKILSTKSNKFKRFFEVTLANDPGMQARNAAEAKAVEQIKAGTYGGRTLTHKVWEDTL
ncbi:YdcF family protein [Patescibacteria group bacterium]|nr:MAG: YdcF family protein [Patescibacteria group bacterium]